MAVSGDAFRDVMSRWATGVTVVTTCHDDELHGMTVNSFSSLTVEPPLVLFCADQSAHTYGLVEASGVFAVNVLSAGQEELSNLFAGRYPERDADRFAGVAYRQAVTGAPILEGSLGYLDCRVVARYPQGYAYHLRRCSRGGGAAAARGAPPPLLPSPLPPVSRSSVVAGTVRGRVCTRPVRHTARD